MYINQFGVGSSVKLIITYNTKNTLVLETRIKEVSQKPIKGLFFVIIEPLYYNGKLLNFDSITCRAELLNSEDNRVYAYNDISIKNLAVGGRKSQYLFSGSTVRPLNRREAVRVPMLERASIQVGANTKAYKGLVHDISATGISFNVESGSKIAEGDKFNACFEYSRGGSSFRVSGTVVRCVQNDNDTLFIGCKMEEYPTSLNAVIAELLRRECKLRRQEGR